VRFRRVTKAPENKGNCAAIALAGYVPSAISVKVCPPQGGAEIGVKVTSALQACSHKLPVTTQLRSNCRSGYAPSAISVKVCPPQGGAEIAVKATNTLQAKKHTRLNATRAARAQFRVMPCPHISVKVFPPQGGRKVR
jgi:hypothetical protein